MKRKTRFAERLAGPFSVKEILHAIAISRTEQERILLDDISVKVGSTRLKTFIKGTQCVTCGIDATFFAVDKGFSGSIHLNLYALSLSGDEVLMTSDHIFPKSRGGSDALENRQPMCAPCNETKGAHI